MYSMMIVSAILPLLFGIALGAEPSGIRHLRYMSQCNSKCPGTIASVVACCKSFNAGNWATCDKFNQAICAWKEITWSADGNTECVSYPGFGQCVTRYQLTNS